MHSGFCQFTFDRYHPKEIIKNQKVDTCKIFNKEKDKLILQQEIIYLADGSESEYIDISNECSTKYYYNKNGMKIAEYFIPFGGSFLEKDTLLYDEHGNKYRQIKYSKNGTEASSSEYEYTGNKPVVEKYFSKGNLEMIYKNVYDSRNRLKKVKYILLKNANGYCTYKYDKNNNFIQFKAINVSGEVTLRQEYKYDKKNLRTELDVYGLNNKLIQMYKTNYLESGLIDSEEWFTGIKNENMNDSDHEIKIYQYTYRQEK